MLTRTLVGHELQQLLIRLNWPESPTPEGTLIFEGIFHLGKATAVFTRTGEDVDEFSIHYAALDDGVIRDAPPSIAQRALVDARVVTFVTALQGFYFAETKLDRIIHHDAGPAVQNALGRLVGIDYDADGHRLPGQPPANPALSSTIVSVPGTCATASQLPPQVAVTVTLKTEFRRQWGRVYLPLEDRALIRTGTTHAEGAGQIDADAVATIRDAAGALLEGLSDDGVPWVIWSAKHQHALSVDQVQVDSLFDVQRRRRFDRAATFETHTLGA